MKYCPSPWSFSRRSAREVTVGNPSLGGVVLGGNHPVVKQSMLTCDTMDTAEWPWVARLSASRPPP